MQSNATSTNKPLGVFDALGLMFICLQLMGYITWSWWAVLAPFYIPAAVSFCFGLIVGFVHARRAQSA